MADKALAEVLKDQALQIRKDLLRLCNQAPHTHIGGELSMVELAVCLYSQAMRFDPKNPRWDKRDRLYLGKGHACATLFFCQAACGYYPKEDIYQNYNHIGSRFGEHPCADALNTFEVSTGSLGHALALGVGTALGLRIDGSDARAFVIMGDGEMHEGSVWEALMAAAQYQLGNLVAIVDKNNVCLDGATKDVMCLDPLPDKLRAFRWNVIEVDGHDVSAICDAFAQLPAPDSLQPTVIVANTIKGKGVGFMEGKAAYHAGHLDDETYAACIRALDEQRAAEKEAV